MKNEEVKTDYAKLVDGLRKVLPLQSNSTKKNNTPKKPDSPNLNRLKSEFSIDSSIKVGQGKLLIPGSLNKNESTKLAPKPSGRKRGLSL